VADDEQETSPVGEVARAGWATVSIVLVIVGYAVAATGPDVPGGGAFGALLVVGGLAATGVSLARPDGLSPSGQLLVLVGLATAVAFHSIDSITHQAGYGTDAAAFNQFSAELVRHGSNPYASTMQPALAQFHVPTVDWTYRLDGSLVTSLSYPAGAFLVYVPFVSLGFKTQLANVVDIGAWLITGGLLWRLLPPAHRWIAGLLLGLWPFADYVIGGGTDALWLPFGIVALWRWDRYADQADTSVARWIGPFALGAAVSIKQLPWFLAPFLLIGVAIEARRRGDDAFGVLRAYGSRAAGVFLVVNLPFLLWGFRDWWSGVLTPLREPLVADGQGLVSISLISGHGGGLLIAYTLAALCAYGAALAAFITRYDRLKRVWPLLVGLVMFLPTRSYASYVLTLLPIVIVAALTTREPAPGQASISASTNSRSSARLAGSVTIVLALLATTCTAAALLAPDPLAITVVSSRSTGELQTISELVVAVHNRSNHELVPRFRVQWGGRASAFWRAEVEDTHADADGRTIRAHETVRLRLLAPSAEAMVPISRAFAVQAFTEGPAAASRSTTVAGHSDRVVLDPAVVAHTVLTGQSLTITAQMTDLQGAPIREADVPVAMGQVVYNQNALLPGLAALNGNPEGQTPVDAMTDDAGQVRFTVVGVQAQAEPVFFQAWIAYPGAEPYGYSAQLAIQFRPP
jgi:uncharacterized membrane protein